MAIPFEKGWGKGVATFLTGVHDGTIRLRGKRHPDLRTLDGVVVMGGWAEDEECRAALANSPFPVQFADRPRTAALDALPFFGDPDSTLVCDVGKTFFKIRFRSVTKLFARNFTTFPFPTLLGAAARQQARKCLRDFLLTKIQAVVAEAGGFPETVAVALPCVISGKGIPTGEPFLGMRDWDTLATDLFYGSRLRPKKVLLLNNAELAGLASLRQPDMASYGSSLVMSWGYAVGLCRVSPVVLPIRTAAPSKPKARV